MVRLSWPGKLVTYWDGLPIQEQTEPDVNWSNFVDRNQCVTKLLPDVNNEQIQRKTNKRKPLWLVKLASTSGSMLEQGMQQHPELFGMMQQKIVTMNNITALCRPKHLRIRNRLELYMWRNFHVRKFHKLMGWLKRHGQPKRPQGLWSTAQVHPEFWMAGTDTAGQLNISQECEWM